MALHRFHWESLSGQSHQDLGISLSNFLSRLACTEKIISSHDARIRSMVCIKNHQSVLGQERWNKDTTVPTWWTPNDLPLDADRRYAPSVAVQWGPLVNTTSQSWSSSSNIGPWSVPYEAEIQCEKTGRYRAPLLSSRERRSWLDRKNRDKSGRRHQETKSWNYLRKS